MGGNPRHDTLRLSFITVPTAIDRGVAILSELIAEEMKR